MIVKNRVNCGIEQILVKEQKKNDIRHVTYDYLRVQHVLCVCKQVTAYIDADLRLVIM